MHRDHDTAARWQRLINAIEIWYMDASEPALAIEIAAEIVNTCVYLLPTGACVHPRRPRFLLPDLVSPFVLTYSLTRPHPQPIQV